MKLDLVRSDPHYYGAPAQPVLRTFGTYGYATVTGRGAPLGEAYTEAVGRLYRAVYGAKKRSKAAGLDFVAPKLEGLWWVESTEPPLTVPGELWHWKMMIRLPEFVTAETVEGAAYEELCEGEAVQVMHRGPYAAEPETLARMEEFLRAEGLAMNGRHHEIYLSDPRRANPETMRTVLRHPVRRLAGQPQVRPR